MQQMEKDRRDSIFVCGTTGGLAVFLAPPQEAVANCEIITRVVYTTPLLVYLLLDPIRVCVTTISLC